MALTRLLPGVIQFISPCSALCNVTYQCLKPLGLGSPLPLVNRKTQSIDQICIHFTSTTTGKVRSINTSIIWLCGSIQVSGDGPPLPSLRPNPNPKPAPMQTLGLREGRVGPSPETCIDPQSRMIDVTHIMLCYAPANLIAEPPFCIRHMHCFHYFLYSCMFMQNIHANLHNTSPEEAQFQTLLQKGNRTSPYQLISDTKQLWSTAEVKD